MAETMLRERCLESENSEQELKNLNQVLYPATFVPLAPEDDPFADTDAAGLIPPWA